ncbi:MAG TPA: glycosyltransferase, partial [Anaerolineales bacterium]|nr:glycosyltransferase [Anaerolineales bacterium]
PNIRLLMVGSGPELGNMKEWAQHIGIADRVHFTGQVAYNQIPRYLVTSDIFVTASVTEVHPLTVIEAMASGLPVLGIESPGVGDTITDDENGYLIPNEDLAAFTAKMVRLITDGVLRQKMGAQARQTAQRYSYERTSQHMLEIYEQVIAEHAVHRGLRARWIRFWDRWR